VIAPAQGAVRGSTANAKALYLTVSAGKSLWLPAALAMTGSKTGGSGRMPSEALGELKAFNRK
jgi:hypothetical protein